MHLIQSQESKNNQEPSRKPPLFEPLRTPVKPSVSDPRKQKEETESLNPPQRSLSIGRGSYVPRCLPWPRPSLPVALPPAATTLEMLPSATSFLACAAATLGPAAPSGAAGRFTVAASEDEQREAATIDILTAGELVTAAPLSLATATSKGVGDGRGEERRGQGKSNDRGWRGAYHLPFAPKGRGTVTLLFPSKNGWLRLIVIIPGEQYSSYMQ
jgi:hypothetical protein